MRKLAAILLSLTLIFGCFVSAFADDNPSKSDREYFRSTNTNVAYEIESDHGFKAGESTNITVYMFNRSLQALSDAYIQLSLPSGMTITEGAERQFVNCFGALSVVSATFPVTCLETAKEGSYPITAIISGENIGIDVEAASIISDIVGVGDFFVNINESDYSLSSLLDAGGKLAITLAANGLPASVTSVSVPVNETFYVQVAEADEEEISEAASNPVLMLTTFSAGSDSIMAGDDFTLNFTLHNTSKVDLRNVRVTVDGGTAFLTSNTSNRIYVESIKAGADKQLSIKLSSQKSASQGPHAITVTSAYDYAASSSSTSTDYISVSVSHPVRLVVDDILDPGYLTADSSGYISVNYRNMGQDTIYNLVITVDGDFELTEGESYYAGNMASGRSDYYSFSFYTYDPGECTGTVTFTFEDADGIEHVMEKAFLLNIGEAYVWDDEADISGDIDEPTVGMPLWGRIIIALGAVIVLIIVLKILKKRKMKKQEALDLDE